MESKPLSPHLQIYRPQLTSVLSISHRASGIFLGTAGLLALVVWLGSIALGPSQYEMTMSFLRHPLMLPVLLLWTGAFYYHLSNGIRHLFWDMGGRFGAIHCLQKRLCRYRVHCSINFSHLDLRVF